MSQIAFENISTLITASSKNGRKSGKEMNDIGCITDAAIVFDEKIQWIGSTEELHAKLASGELIAEKIISQKGKTILPGFVDSHTHIVFAGSRANEYARRLQGVSYQQIAAEGGGILSTMRAVRNASVEELAEVGLYYARSAMKYGTTTIEVKSGYGLSFESEMNQLKAIQLMKKEIPMTVISTFLGAHDIPPEYKENREQYIDILCNEMIPYVAENTLADFCDIFTDTGYYTIEETEKILGTAIEYGLKIKIHADELTPVAAAECAARMNAVSADHLLCISDDGMKQMAEKGVIGTLLPGTAYNLRLPYAPARAMIDNTMAIALATDCNPGSCLCENMQMMISLACTNMRMTVEEAINASTVNGAAALQLENKGQLSVGKDADMIIMPTNEYATLAYHFGINHAENVWIKGQQL